MPCDTSPPFPPSLPFYLLRVQRHRRLYYVIGTTIVAAAAAARSTASPVCFLLPQHHDGVFVLAVRATWLCWVREKDMDAGKVMSLIREWYKPALSSFCRQTTSLSWMPLLEIEESHDDGGGIAKSEATRKRARGAYFPQHHNAH